MKNCKLKRLGSGWFNYRVIKSVSTAVFGISLFLLMTSCQNDTMAYFDNETCDATGGKVVYGIIGAVCAMPTSDAGQSCSDISECEGLCLSDGECSEWDNNFGCTEVLVEGETVTICID